MALTLRPFLHQQKESQTFIQAFTVTFPDHHSYNEGDLAEATAACFGAGFHTVLFPMRRR